MTEDEGACRHAAAPSKGREMGHLGCRVGYTEFEKEESGVGQDWWWGDGFSLVSCYGFRVICASRSKL